MFIDAGEADKSDLVNFAEVLHDAFADLAGGDFGIEATFDFGEDIGDHHFNLLVIDGTFFDGALDSVEDFVAIEAFATSVIFEDGEVLADNFLDGGKAVFAGLAGASAADGEAIGGDARINDAGILGGTFWALHGVKRCKEGMGRGGSMPIGLGKLKLAECFVTGDGDGAGEVEGAERFRMEAGDGEAVWVTDCLMEPIGATMALVAEEEAIAREEGSVPEGAFGVGGKEPEPAGGGGVLLEGLKRRMDMELKLLPVIHSGAAEVFVVEGEAEGFDEVEGSGGEGAEAADVAGVLGDFRLEEDDMEARRHGPDQR